MIKKNLIIIGAGGHTRSVVSAAKLMNIWNQIKILDISYNYQTEEIMGIQIEPYKNLSIYSKSKDISFFISIGDNKKREIIYNSLIDQKANFANVVHPLSYIDKTSLIGNGNYIGQFSNLGAYSKIGNFNIINTSSNLEHESSLGNFNHLAPGSVVCGRSEIKNNIFIGSNSVVVEKKLISDNNIIGAGSVVIKSIKSKGGKYVGIPAKKI